MAETRKIKAVLEAENRASPAFKALTLDVRQLAVRAAALAAVTGAALAVGIGKATQASSRYESAVTRLAVVLQNQGENTKEIRADLLGFAEDLSKVSLATETQIIAAVGQAKALGASNEAAKKLVRSATDLAVVLGVDNETAFRQVTRTLGGYAGELGEIIPELKDLTKEQLQAGAAADIILRKFQGAGQAGAATLAGALNNLGSTFDKLLVQVGGPFRDAFTETINTALLPMLDNVNEQKVAFGVYRGFVLNSAAALLDLTAVVVDLLAPLRDLLQAIALLSVVQFKADIELVTKVLERLQGALGFEESEAGDRFRAAADALRELATSADDAGEKVERSFKGKAAPAVKETKEEVEGLQEKVTVTTGAIIDQAEAISRFARDGAAVLNAQLSQSQSEVEGLGSALDREIRGTGVRAADALGDELARAAFEGDLSFSQFFNNLAQQITAAIAKAFILRAVLAATGVGAVSGGGGGGFGTFLSGRTFGLQSGGIVGGNPIIGKDTVLRGLQPGEAVLPRNLTNLLLDAANGGNRGESQEIVLRMEEGIVAERLTRGVRRGRVRLESTAVFGTRARR